MDLKEKSAVAHATSAIGPAYPDIAKGSGLRFSATLSRVRHQGSPGRRRRQRRAAAATTALVVPLLTVGCSQETTPESSPRDEGPLRVSLDGGGSSLAAPRHAADWTGTFGSLDLCSDSGEPLTLRTISYEFQQEPLSATSVVRVLDVPAGEDRTPAQAPVLALRGSADTLFAHEFEAKELASPEGYVVHRPCSDGPHAVYDELVTSMRVDAAGGWISGLQIAYTDGDSAYLRTVDWNYVMCGDAIADDRVC